MSSAAGPERHVFRRTDGEAEPLSGASLTGGSSAQFGAGSEDASGLSSSSAPGRDWRRFDGPELAIVCSHYDIGVLQSVREYRKGSSRSPKAVLQTSTGKYLLKRRAPGRDEERRIRFAHDVQRVLASRGYPVAPLVPTRDSGQALLRVEEHAYELFEFVEGEKYDRTPEATFGAGKSLAAFHRLLGDHAAGADPLPSSMNGTYHNAGGLAARLSTIPGKVGGGESLVATLRELYRQSAARVEARGIATWPRQTIHADWHPGNLLFEEDRVVCVLDFDSARIAPRIIDIANGVLQFSMRYSRKAPHHWPTELDLGCIERFCRGYDSVKGCVMSTAECEALPWLMIEALIVEATLPIAATGTFGGLDGLEFLGMVERRAEWIRGEASSISEHIY